MSSPEREFVASETRSSKIRHGLETFLDRCEIGSPKIIAFADFAREINLTTILQSIRDNDSYKHTVLNQISIVREKIADRRATMKGYNKNHREAVCRYDDLCKALCAENYRGNNYGKIYESTMVICYDLAAKKFCQIVEERLNRD